MTGQNGGGVSADDPAAAATDDECGQPSTAEEKDVAEKGERKLKQGDEPDATELAPGLDGQELGGLQSASRLSSA